MIAAMGRKQQAGKGGGILLQGNSILAKEQYSALMGSIIVEKNGVGRRG